MRQGSPGGQSGGGARRAPRLAPDEHIASLITRRGRFKARDPSRGRELPSFWGVLATILWGVLLGMSFRRAVEEQRSGTEGETAPGGV